jgi:hypothetical protein
VPGRPLSARTGYKCLVPGLVGCTVDYILVEELGKPALEASVRSRDRKGYKCSVPGWLGRVVGGFLAEELAAPLPHAKLAEAQRLHRETVWDYASVSLGVLRTNSRSSHLPHVFGRWRCRWCRPGTLTSVPLLLHVENCYRDQSNQNRDTADGSSHDGTGTVKT